MGRKRKRSVPQVKVNIHFEDGSREVDVCNVAHLREGEATNVQQNVDQRSAQDDISEVDDLPDDTDSLADESGTLSNHYLKAQKKHKSWEKMREEVLQMTFRINGALANSKCMLCGHAGECICKDCGPMCSYCKTCAEQVHTQVNIFHRVEILKNGIFYPMQLCRRLKSICSCDSSRQVQSIVVVDFSGSYFEVEIEFCNCQPKFVQLIQFGLWGATPSKPTMAFSIQLLELWHALQMECQISIKKICQAYREFNWSKISNVGPREIYPVILDSFEEYRLYRHKLTTLTCILPDLDNGNVCPACPKDEGFLFESLDALFIGRRKNAGQSVNDPLFGDLMFYPQKEVDQFVSNYYSGNQPSRSEAVGCHQFLAGNAIRSTHRYKALSETAVFGRGCRHEFPKKFLSLKHGERLAYAVWMIEDIEKQLLEKPNLNIKILYDISCMLVKHLQSKGEDEHLDVIDFAIPIFHCYGHEGECQVKFSPRRKAGFGLTDGEMLERLWAYLRPFGKMTKEMRPSHRTDVLTDALLHYGRQTIQKLGPMLVKRMQRSIVMEEDANKDLDNLLKSLAVPVTKELVQQWATEEVQDMQKETQTEEIVWEQKYVMYLQIFYNLAERWQNCTDANRLTTFHNQMQKVDSFLLDMEKENNISRRWKSTDEQFVEVKKNISEDKIKLSLRNLRKSVVERWFLLSLKSKYFDGQALAGRLAKQINRITKKVTRLIESYNKIERGQASQFPIHVNFDEVKDPDSTFWSSVAGSSTESYVPFALKRKAIDLYHMAKRCVEEKSLLKDEMTNFSIFLSDQHAILSNFIFQDPLDSEESGDVSGAKRLARMKLLATESTMMSLKSIFSSFIHVSFPQFKIFSQELAPGPATVQLEDDEEEIFSIKQSNDTSKDVYETDSENDETDNYEECASDDDDDEAYVELIYSS